MFRSLIKSSRLSRFAREETGTVTVDWVVLTAGVVGLVSAIFLALGNDTADYSERIGSHMSAQSIKTSY